MKKSFIALAVMVASGAAMAQSSVTLYGIVDLWYGNVKSGAPGAQTSTTQLTSGGLAGSRWGLKGEEDLGGGLKAVFKLEQGFNADDGTQSVSGTAFSRQAYVGVAGGFGQVTFGNTWTAMDDVIGAANSGFDSALSANASVWKSTGVYESNPGNTIKYTSPSFGGFTGAFSYSLDEAPGSADIYDFNLAYEEGPVAAAFSYQVQRGTPSLKISTLNGSYDLGAVKLLASYARVTNELVAGDKTTEYQIGVDVPLSNALTLSAGYARSKDNLSLGGDRRSGYGVALGYSMSKRTTLYTGFRTGNTKNAGVKTDKETVYAVGINHAF